MTTTPSEPSPSVELQTIEPQTPTERILFLAVIMGVAALVVLGIGATWCVMTMQGDADAFPGELQNAFYAGLAFLFGGGIAAKV